MQKLLRYTIAFAVLVVLVPSDARACDAAWKICGPATCDGTISVTFEVFQPPSCYPDASDQFSDLDTALSICERLDDRLSYDCGECVFDCSQPVNGCVLLSEVANCENCDTVSASSSGCGITITRYPTP